MPARGALLQPGLLAGRVNGLEQHLAIRPDDRRQGLAVRCSSDEPGAKLTQDGMVAAGGGEVEA
jgi:hypothetical protein